MESKAKLAEKVKAVNHTMYIRRSLEKVVEQVTQEYPVVLVTGPRQVGKTTMLQKLMEGTSRGYVSLDDLNERALAKNDPELFLQLHKPPVLIDEVQYAPELFTYIKVYGCTSETGEAKQAGRYQRHF